MTRFPRFASFVQTSTTSSPRNCASSIPTTSVRGESFSMISAALKTASEGMPRPECETISLAAYRSSMAGLKICTRCRAISARRSRRINSSLFPENIGPTTTSIQPILPLTISTRLLLAKFPPLLTPICSHLLSRSGRCMVHLRVIRRGKGRDDGHAKCLRAANQAARKHAPGALGVANSYRSREAIDGRGEFHSVLQNLSCQGVRDLDPARSSVMPVAAIRHVGPALQQDPPLAFLLDDVQPTLQSDKISPRFRLLARQVHQCFDPLPHSLHQFRSICWRVTHAAVDLVADHLELPAGGEHGGKIPDRLAHRHKLRPPRTAHRD